MKLWSRWNQEGGVEGNTAPGVPSCNSPQAMVDPLTQCHPVLTPVSKPGRAHQNHLDHLDSLGCHWWEPWVQTEGESPGDGATAGLGLHWEDLWARRDPRAQCDCLLVLKEWEWK